MFEAFWDEAVVLFSRRERNDGECEIEGRARRK